MGQTPVQVGQRFSAFACKDSLPDCLEFEKVLCEISPCSELMEFAWKELWWTGGWEKELEIWEARIADGHKLCWAMRDLCGPDNFGGAVGSMSSSWTRLNPRTGSVIMQFFFLWGKDIRTQFQNSNFNRSVLLSAWIGLYQVHVVGTINSIAKYRVKIKNFHFLFQFCSSNRPFRFHGVNARPVLVCPLEISHSYFVTERGWLVRAQPNLHTREMELEKWKSYISRQKIQCWFTITGWLINFSWNGVGSKWLQKKKKKKYIKSRGKEKNLEREISDASRLFVKNFLVLVNAIVMWINGNLVASCEPHVSPWFSNHFQINVSFSN
jgi:hypothetical protein